MSKLRKGELNHCRHIMKTLNAVVVASAEQAGEHSSRVLVEDSDLDKEIGEIYAQAVGELRQAFRTISAVEERLQPAAAGRKFLGGIFSRAFWGLR